MNFRKIKEKLNDARVLLALVGVLILPSFFCSIFLGYVPEVAMWFLYAGGIPFAYIALITFFIPIGGWIIQVIKKVKK